MPLLPPSASDATRFRAIQSSILPDPVKKEATYLYSRDLDIATYLRASDVGSHMDPSLSVLEFPQWKKGCNKTCPNLVPSIDILTGGSMEFKAQQNEDGVPTRSWITIPNNGSFAPTGNFTIQWFQFMNNVQPFPRVFSIANAYFSFYFDENDDHYDMVLFVLNVPYFFGVFRKNVIVNAWHFFSLHYVSGTFTLYINGTLFGSVTPPSFALTDTTTPLLIGQNQDFNGASEGFNGYITNFHWANTTLSPSVPWKPIYGVPETVLLLRASYVYAPGKDGGPLSKETTAVGVEWSNMTPLH